MLSVGLYSYLQNYLSLFGRVRWQLPNEEVKKGEREKVEKKKKKKSDLQIAILEIIYKFLVFLRKMKEKKLSNEYEPLFIPKGL